jgi:ABC-2 type transport system permease protein
MRKFLAVVKHEYRKVVLKWSFLIGTLLLPVLAGLFPAVMLIIFSIKGEPTRIAVVDPSQRIGQRIRQNLSPEAISERAKRAAAESLKDLNASQEDRLKRGSEQLSSEFAFIDYDATGKSTEVIRRDLIGQITSGQLDAYLIVPADIDSPAAVFEYRSRRAGDFVAGGAFKDAVNEAVRAERLRRAKIDESVLRTAGTPVEFDEKGIDDQGEETSNEGTFIAAFIIGLLIYVTLAIYGQVIMAAVVEEKETRIAEILFSSASPFTLMAGKLVGVGLAGLTQLAIWIVSASVLLGIGLAQMSAAGIELSTPTITPVMIVLFFIFFLLGFFLYASIFALIGSMVTTVQEGGQFAFPPILILLAAFYFSFAVIRDPNSTVSFWASVAPFLAPITMPVRILAEMPPVWHLLLAVVLNSAAIAAMVWLTARVYRVGMLMYGKRATIPEVLKWMRRG